MATSTTSQQMAASAHTGAWVKWALAAGATIFVLFLFFYNLTDYPKTWFDEGSHLHVPKALVTRGVYADYSSEGLRHYGPTIGVGPTVMLPVAGAFQLFGVGMLQARLVMVLYSRLGVVQQVPWLFADSIAANIRFGRLGATDDEVRDAAIRTGAWRFIERLPEGMGFQVGEGGERLSHGQRQLVSLARAVLANPDILVMDEATSSVDSETERAIQSAIDTVLQDRIGLVIAHRLSTVRRADRILVIDQGRIVESGPHAELVRCAGGRYRALYLEQFVHEREDACVGAGAGTESDADAGARTDARGAGSVAQG